MKRLFVRLSALSTVVVLGLFAIAQAQRQAGGNESSDASAGNKTTRFVDEAADDSVGRSPATGRDDSGVHIVRDEPNDSRQGRGVRPEVQRDDLEAGPRSGAFGMRRPSERTAGRNGRIEGEIADARQGTTLANAGDDDGTRVDPPRLGLPLPPRDSRQREVLASADSDVVEVSAESTDETANATDSGVKPDAASRSASGRNTAGPNAGSSIATERSPTSRRGAAASDPHGETETKIPQAPGRADQRPAARMLDRDVAGTELTPARELDAASAAAGERATGATEGAGTPGGRDLEGLQIPSLTIEKVAPPEIQVGKAAMFEIRLQNSGKSTARNVQIVDQVPQGTRLVSTDPRADVGERGELSWVVPTLAPGATTTVKVELMPLTEGTIGSVASIVFRADASARTTATKPQIKVDVAPLGKVMIGDEAVIAITVTNPGTGVANGVVLEADVPPGLKHPAGNELEFEVGVLKPKESRRLELAMTAAKAGAAKSTLVVRADGVPPVEHVVQFEIVAPKLEVGFDGPKRRFLDRKATHVLLVSNPGTANAKDIELVAYLPKGMKFVEANNHGSYDARQHAVYWSLEELPAQKSGDVQLVTLPTEAGEQKIRVEGKAAQGLSDAREETISVEGVSALSFQIADLADPLEVGGQASYEVRVINTGSKSSNNVQVTIDLPPQMAPIDATGPTGSKLQGTRIVFDPIGRLAPKEEKTFRVRAETKAAGDLRVRVQLLSDDMRQPVTQEESTRVFADQ